MAFLTVSGQSVICITAGGAVAKASQLEAGRFPVLSDQRDDTDHRNVVRLPPLLIEDVNRGRLSHHAQVRTLHKNSNPNPNPKTDNLSSQWANSLPWALCLPARLQPGLAPSEDSAEPPPRPNFPHLLHFSSAKEVFGQTLYLVLSASAPSTMKKKRKVTTVGGRRLFSR